MKYAWMWCASLRMTRFGMRTNSVYIVSSAADLQKKMNDRGDKIYKLMLNQMLKFMELRERKKWL